MYRTLYEDVSKQRIALLQIPMGTDTVESKFYRQSSKQTEWASKPTPTRYFRSKVSIFAHVSLLVSAWLSDSDLLPIGAFLGIQSTHC